MPGEKVCQTVIGPATPQTVPHERFLQEGLWVLGGNPQVLAEGVLLWMGELCYAHLCYSKKAQDPTSYTWVFVFLSACFWFWTVSPDLSSTLLCSEHSLPGTSAGGAALLVPLAAEWVGWGVWGRELRVQVMPLIACTYQVSVHAFAIKDHRHWGTAHTPYFTMKWSGVSNNAIQKEWILHVLISSNITLYTLHHVHIVNHIASYCLHVKLIHQTNKKTVIKIN